MTFADKLKKLMEDLDLTQGEIHKITGIGRSSISQYLSGKNEPSQMRKQEIARALGVQETYFEMFEPAATVQHDGVVNFARYPCGKADEEIQRMGYARVKGWRFPVGLCGEADKLELLYFFREVHRIHGN